MMNINLWRDDVLGHAILGYARRIDSFARRYVVSSFIWLSVVAVAFEKNR